MCISTDESIRCHRKPFVTNNEHDYSTWNINDYDIDLSDYLIDTNSKESTHHEPAQDKPKELFVSDIDCAANPNEGALEASSKRYACPVCSKLWVTPSKLRRHMNVHKDEHQMNDPTIRNLIEPSPSCDQQEIQNFVKCPTCSEALKSQAELMLHMSVHIKDELRAEMRMEQAFIKEVPMAEKIGKRYFCTVCRHETSSPAKMKAHMSKFHMKITKADLKPYYNCTSCPESFGSETLLQRHINNQHPRSRLAKRRRGAKNHPCLHCDKRFETPSKLLRHQSVHRPNSESTESSVPQILEITAVTNILGDWNRFCSIKKFPPKILICWSKRRDCIISNFIRVDTLISEN